MGRWPRRAASASSSVVSNLLGSPASGEETIGLDFANSVSVSNLLGSPASGEELFLANPEFSKKVRFPIYWVPQRVGRTHPVSYRTFTTPCFLFIGFPSEWGVFRAGDVGSDGGRRVSNLLGSPASGEWYFPYSFLDSLECFQFIGFPSEWGDTLLKPAWIRNGKGRLRASFEIVVHCTVSCSIKSPQTLSGSHVEHLHAKIGISRFWLDPRRQI